MFGKNREALKAIQEIAESVMRLGESVSKAQLSSATTMQKLGDHLVIQKGLISALALKQTELGNRLHLVETFISEFINGNGVRTH